VASELPASEQEAAPEPSPPEESVAEAPPAPETPTMSTGAAAENPPSVAGTTGPQPSADPSAAELTAFLTDYYAILPGDTDAGWERLTANFQNGTAQDRAYYERFWGRIDRVTVSDVTATPPDTVQATVTYAFSNGSTSVEDTVYSVIRDGDTLKIDSSTVLSSR
jgi:hypothetical protein